MPPRSRSPRSETDRSGRTTRTPVARFQALAGRAGSNHYAIDLLPGSVPGAAKKFDFVSPERRVVGDAKYFVVTGGVRLPSAKFSIIAEHVWLLEKTNAATTFLMFGNDRDVPLHRLARYGGLTSKVEFFFLSEDAALERPAGRAQ